MRRLLEDLDELDWSESIKDMQRNWIGRSEVRLAGFWVGDGRVGSEAQQGFFGAERDAAQVDGVQQGAACGVWGVNTYHSCCQD